MTPPFVPLAVAWFAGLWLADWLSLPLSVWLILWLLSILILPLWLLRTPLSAPYTHHPIIMAMLIAIFLLGGASRAAAATMFSSGLS